MLFTQTEIDEIDVWLQDSPLILPLSRSIIEEIERSLTTNDENTTMPLVTILPLPPPPGLSEDTTSLDVKESTWPQEGRMHTLMNMR